MERTEKQMVDYASMYQLNCGLFVASTAWEGKLNGCVVNTVLQVTYEPLKCIVVIDKKNLTHDMVMKSRSIGVSVFSEEVSLEDIGRFGFSSGREQDKFDGVPYTLDVQGNPLLTKGVSAVFSFSVEETVDVGTHTVFVCAVKQAETVSASPAITYRQYRDKKLGNKAPAGDKEGDVYLCTVCKYEYDEAKEGVPFDELPDDWVCPICKRPKSAFKKIEK